MYDPYFSDITMKSRKTVTSSVEVTKKHVEEAESYQTSTTRVQQLSA